MMIKVQAVFLSLAAFSYATFPSSSSFQESALDPPSIEYRCAPITLLFAPAPAELGPIGVSVGPPLLLGLRRAFGLDTVAVRTVRSVRPVRRHNGKQHGDQTTGTRRMLDVAIRTQQDCPQSRIVLAGHRQGAEKVHGALASMPQELNIAAALTFSDPMWNHEFANVPVYKTKINCVDDDRICHDNPLGTNIGGLPIRVPYGSEEIVQANIRFLYDLFRNAGTPLPVVTLPAPEPAPISPFEVAPVVYATQVVTITNIIYSTTVHYSTRVITPQPIYYTPDVSILTIAITQPAPVTQIIPVTEVLTVTSILPTTIISTSIMAAPTVLVPNPVVRTSTVAIPWTSLSTATLAAPTLSIPVQSFEPSVLPMPATLTRTRTLAEVPTIIVPSYSVSNSIVTVPLIRTETARAFPTAIQGTPSVKTSLVLAPTTLIKTNTLASSFATPSIQTSIRGIASKASLKSSAFALSSSLSPRPTSLVPNSVNPTLIRSSTIAAQSVLTKSSLSPSKAAPSLVRSSAFSLAPSALVPTSRAQSATILAVPTMIRSSTRAVLPTSLAAAPPALAPTPRIPTASIAAQPTPVRSIAPAAPTLLRSPPPAQPTQPKATVLAAQPKPPKPEPKPAPAPVLASSHWNATSVRSAPVLRARGPRKADEIPQLVRPSDDDDEEDEEQERTFTKWKRYITLKLGGRGCNNNARSRMCYV